VKDFVVKYCQTTFMTVICLYPFVAGPKRLKGVGDNAQALYEMRFMADLVLHEFYALGQIMRLWQTWQASGGLVDRVGGMMLEMKKLRDKGGTALEGENAAKMGTVEEGETISFEDVTIRTPTGNVLVEGLTFEVKEQDHLLVCGPNGAGKSSIFRCLGSLWSIPKGTIRRPGGGKEGLVADVFYLPQKPYNVLGSLKEQITYPDPPEKSSELDDTMLRGLLRMVELEHLMDMNAETTNNWEDKLSLGETQRLAMARLFWHTPKYAILDECTAAVSLKMEERLFVTCRRLGITLITISHRPALQEYHNRMLVLDGNGSYKEMPIDQSEEAKGGAYDIMAAGKSRKESFQIIMQELERAGDIGGHHKAGASLQATDKVKLERGLWGRMAQINALMFQSSSEQLFSLSSLAGLVVFRTFLSNSIAHTNGEALQAMLAQDQRAFFFVILKSLLQGFSQAMLAPTLMKLEEFMSLKWRTRLTEYILERYFKHQAYFKLKETMPDMAEIGAIDQVLAEDIKALADGVANLWHDFVKPVVDILWFARAMWVLTGSKGMIWQYTYVVAGTLVLKLVKPNLAELTATKEKLDGEFTFVHSRLKQHAESVAFFNGGQAEKRIIEGHFDRKIEHQRVQKRAEHRYGVWQQFIVHFLPQNVVWFLSSIYQQQYVERIGISPEEMSQEQQGVLSHDLRYLGTVVTHTFSAFGSIMEVYGKAETLLGHVHRVSKLIESLEKVEKLEAGAATGDTGQVALTAGTDVIEFKQADILTPNHTQVLISKLDFKLERGKDVGVLITGPNGVGKTSIFRILSDIWPLHQGSVKSPMPQTDVLFVPTKPYMPVGTLADQITYPIRLPRLEKEGKKGVFYYSEEHTERLMSCATRVRLAYLAEREGKEFGGAFCGDVKDKWADMFSLGEQQRLNVARVLWHKPRFACLDECTSAVALDGEEEIYSHIRDVGCTVLTASQKPWLTNFHSSILELQADGKGGWEQNPIDESNKFKGLTRLNASAYVDMRQADAGGAAAFDSLAAAADKIFESADRDSNGLLTRSEIKKQLNKHLDVKNMVMQGEGYAAMFKELDADQDGNITPQEWRDFYIKRIEQAKQ